MKVNSLPLFPVVLTLLTPLLFLSFTGCSKPMSPDPFTETLSVGSPQRATIKSFQEGGNYISITGIDGVEVPSSEIYHVSPGKRRIQMQAKHKGIFIEKMFYTVRLQPGKSYYLESNNVDFTVERSPTGGSYYAIRDFQPLLMDGETGKQLYPKVKK